MLLPSPTFLIFVFKCNTEFSSQSVWLPIVLAQHCDESLLFLFSINQKFRWLFYIYLSSLLLLFQAEKGLFLLLLLMFQASDIFMAFL